VRELRNIVIRLAARYPGQRVDAAALREEFDPDLATADTASLPAAGDRETLIAHAQHQLGARPGGFRLDATLLRWEDAYIEAARRLAHGNVSQMARLLGINRTTLYNRMEVLARQPAASPVSPG